MIQASFKYLFSVCFLMAFLGLGFGMIVTALLYDVYSSETFATIGWCIVVGAFVVSFVLLWFRDSQGFTVS